MQRFRIGTQNGRLLLTDDVRGAELLIGAGMGDGTRDWLHEVCRLLNIASYRIDDPPGNKVMTKCMANAFPTEGNYQDKIGMPDDIDTLLSAAEVEALIKGAAQQNKTAWKLLQALWRALSREEMSYRHQMAIAQVAMHLLTTHNHLCQLATTLSVNVEDELIK